MKKLLLIIVLFVIVSCEKSDIDPYSGCDADIKRFFESEISVNGEYGEIVDSKKRGYSYSFRNCGEMAYPGNGYTIKVISFDGQMLVGVLYKGCKDGNDSPTLCFVDNITVIKQ